MIDSRRLDPIIALRRRTEDAAEIAHAESLRALNEAESWRRHCADQEARTWDAFAPGDARIPGGALNVIAALQAATHRRVISAGADVYDAEQRAEATRTALMHAHAERRAAERLQERARAHERAEAMRTEQATLDELATLSHAWREH